MNKTKENIHAGHRKRLREQVNNEMFELNEIHFLEYLLQFVIPRGDTNPIAHSLLHEFKSIENIFNATEESLRMVKGIGEKAARFIQFMPVICHMYEKSKKLNKPYVGNLSTTIPFIQGILPPSNNEQFIVLIIGKNYMVKHYKIFNGVSHSFVNFDAKMLTEYLIKFKSSFCILAHTHPESSALPSDSDRITFKTLTPLFDSLSIQIIDNLILGDKNYYSFRFNSLKNYDTLQTDLLSNRKFSLERKITKNDNT